MEFVLFAAEGRASCDDLYARRLAEALGAAMAPIAGSTPVPDAEAFASARAQWEALEGEAEARPLIAGSVLPAFAPIAALLSMRRVAILIHAPLSSAPGRTDAERSILAAIEQQMLASVPAIVASSEGAAEAITAGTAVPRERIAVVEPPTPDVPRALGSTRGETVIFSPRAPIADHAHEVLFAALAGLPDLEWRLRIVTSTADDPEAAAALAALAAQFGLGNRVQCEPCSDPAAREALWRDSDLFATAAVCPGYGLATAEAMKRGLPVVIAGDTKSAPAIPAEAGAVAPPGDRVQLAKALRRLIFDRDLRASMADAAWRAGKLLPENGAVRERLLAALR